MHDDQAETIMNIIANAGNGKSEAILALRSAKNGDFIAASEHFELAQKSINLSHNAQTDLLSKEANGTEFDINLLTIHSQDHLMNAITFLDLAKEIVDILEMCRN